MFGFCFRTLAVVLVSDFFFLNTAQIKCIVTMPCARVFTGDNNPFTCEGRGGGGTEGGRELQQGEEREDSTAADI